MASDPFLYGALRRALFRIDAERSHEWATSLLRVAQGIAPVMALLRGRYCVDDASLRRRVCGIEFPNPVGLAAGFDKNGFFVHGMAALGFGFVEVGTVTPRAQGGNAKPRLFRLAGDRSLQNAMGFNNDGMEAVRDRLAAAAPFSIPVGINAGKNKDTPQDDAADDFLRVIECCADVADYFVVNVSSPNTPGLRDLQNEDFLSGLVGRTRDVTAKPVFVKLAPDAELDSLVRLAAAACEAEAAGIVAVNTTIDYSLSDEAKDFGGISGRLLRDRSRETLEALRKGLGAGMGAGSPIISVGGIDSGAEAWKRLEMGAELVQVYTGLVYEGPRLARGMNEEVLRRQDEAARSR